MVCSLMKMAVEPKVCSENIIEVIVTINILSLKQAVQGRNLQSGSGVVGRAETGFCSSLFKMSVFSKLLSTPLLSEGSVSSSSGPSVSTIADPVFRSNQVNKNLKIMSNGQ